MTDERKLIPVGENMKEALEAAQTPMATLAAAYNHAPSPLIRSFINRHATEIVLFQLPLLREIMLKGPGVERSVIDGSETEDDEPNSMLSIFKDGMQRCRENSPKQLPTATELQIGEDIAERIDKGIQQILFDDDVMVNRKAVQDLIAGHAQIMAALTELQLSEDAKARLAERDNADSA